MAMRRRAAFAALAACSLAGGGNARAQLARKAIARDEILRGRFVQERHLKGFARPLRSEGRFLLAPERGLIWRAQSPFAVTTVITAAGLVQEVDDRETFRMPAARLPILARLYDLLSASLAGDWRALENGFAVQQRGDEQRWQVTLKPRGTSDPVLEAIAVVELEGSRFIDSVRIDKPSGDFDKLSFSEQELGRAPLSAEEVRLLAQAGR